MKNGNPTDGIIYLLHFSGKLAGHANHYIGFTDDLPARLERHFAGGGASIVKAAVDAGFSIELARTWGPGANRTLERILKNRGEAEKLCPVCSGVVAQTRALYVLEENQWKIKSTNKLAKVRPRPKPTSRRPNSRNS